MLNLWDVIQGCHVDCGVVKIHLIGFSLTDSITTEHTDALTFALWNVKFQKRKEKIYLFQELSLQRFLSFTIENRLLTEASQWVESRGFQRKKLQRQE